MMIVSSAKTFFVDLKKNRKLLIDLAKRDFTSGYHGSIFGITWVFVEPLVYMVLLWFFFSKAAKHPVGTSDFPFVVWLMCGMTMWTFVSNAVSGSVHIFSGHSYLLKQWGFNLSILPFVHVVAMLFLHGAMLFLLIILLLFHKIYPSFWWFQSIYYIFSTSIMVIGLSWLTASISLFIKDVGNFIGILIQFGFWVSPIFWDINSYPEKYKFLLKLNPIYHIIEGYRLTFLYHKGFWTDGWSFGYFWVFTFLILVVGYFSYKKLRPHFGDVLN